jgi:hypothetical protein
LPPTSKFNFPSPTNWNVCAEAVKATRATAGTRKPRRGACDALEIINFSSLGAGDTRLQHAAALFTSVFSWILYS